MTRIAISKVTQLQSGVYLKTADLKTADENQKTFLIGLKDFDEDLSFLGGSVIVDRDEVREKHIIEKNDVLFSTRLKFNAFRLPQTEDVYVASNSFIIVKPNLDKVLPNYLVWYLNHPDTQKQLALMAQRSSRMPYISLKKITGLEINLPQLLDQKRIIEMDKLFKIEKSITRQLLAKKEELYQNILLGISE